MDTLEMIISYIIPLVLGLATVALAIITFFYMKHTRNMARVMQKQTEFLQREFELKVAPLPKSKTEILSSSGTLFNMRVRVINHGAYPLYFESIELQFRHKDVPNMEHKKWITIDDYIEPGGEFISGELKFDYKDFRGFEEVATVQHRGILGVAYNFLDVSKNDYRWPREDFDLYEDIY